jgi:DNA-binding transcriptional ArsR family regulator
MTAKKKFGLADLDGALEEVGNRVVSPVKAFLIGGCAMAYMGSKLSTKDVDVVLLSEKDVVAFGKALKAAGFNTIRASTQDNEGLGIQMMFRNAGEMQFDVFGRTVCRKLEVSNRMAARSTMLKAYGNLEIRLISPEDIFLFKGMTERDGDLDDMALLAQRGLRWEVVKEECMLQKKRQIWELFLFVKLEELEKRHGIRAPIKEELLRAGGEELIAQIFQSIIGDREMTFSEISKEIHAKYRYSPSWTRKQLHMLEEKGIFEKRRSGRIIYYRIIRGR